MHFLSLLNEKSLALIETLRAVGYFTSEPQAYGRCIICDIPGRAGRARRHPHEYGGNFPDRRIVAMRIATHSEAVGDQCRCGALMNLRCAIVASGSCDRAGRSGCRLSWLRFTVSIVDVPKGAGCRGAVYGVSPPGCSDHCWSRRISRLSAGR